MTVSVDLFLLKSLSFTCKLIPSHCVLTWPFICIQAPLTFPYMFKFPFLIRTLVLLVKAHPNVSF